MRRGDFKEDNASPNTVARLATDNNIELTSNEVVYISDHYSSGDIGESKLTKNSKAKSLIEKLNKITEKEDIDISYIDFDKALEISGMDKITYCQKIVGQNVKLKKADAQGTIGKVINYDKDADKILVKLGGEKLITVTSDDITVPEVKKKDESYNRVFLNDDQEDSVDMIMTDKGYKDYDSYDTSIEGNVVIFDKMHAYYINFDGEFEPVDDEKVKEITQ